MNVIDKCRETFIHQWVWLWLLNHFLANISTSTWNSYVHKQYVCTHTVPTHHGWHLPLLETFKMVYNKNSSKHPLATLHIKKTNILTESGCRYFISKYFIEFNKFNKSNNSAVRTHFKNSLKMFQVVYTRDDEKIAFWILCRYFFSQKKA